MDLAAVTIQGETYLGKMEVIKFFPVLHSISNASFPFFSDNSRPIQRRDMMIRQYGI